MTDAFSGNIAQFKLLDVLRILHSGGRTGQLELTHSDGRFAEVYFVSGQITHALYDEYIGEEAVYALFAWLDGTFRFRLDETTDEQTTMLSTEEILAESVSHSADWESVRRVIPSRNTIFRLSSRPTKEFSLRSEDWAVLREVDGEKNLSEVAEATQLSELYASKVIVRLSDLGLVEMAGESVPQQEVVEIIDEAVLRQVEKELTIAIGPMAPIVIDDCAELMGFQRFDLPRDMVPSLLERLAEEIPDSDRRVRFQESMLEIMKQLF